MVNDEALRHYGFSEGEFLAMTVMELIAQSAALPSQATPVVTGAFLSALARWWLDCVSGTVLFVPMLVAVPPIARTLRGRHLEAVTGMFLTVLLAERNRTLRELGATAQRYRRLFAHGPHSLWVEDRATGSIIMVNEQAIRHYGYSEDEWLALKAGDFAATPASTGRFGPAREHGSIETRHRLKSGALIEVELSYAPIYMDGRPTLLCFAVDVTERNALRRGFLEATDLERRRLGNELHLGIGRALAELEFAAKRFKRSALAGPVDSAAIELVAQASRRAAVVCRQTAHTVRAPAG